MDDPIDGAEELLDVPVDASKELLDVPVDAAVPHVVVDVDGAGRGGGLAGRGAQLLAAQEGSQAGAGAGEGCESLTCVLLLKLDGVLKARDRHWF